jgi:hypothetical protein
MNYNPLAEVFGFPTSNKSKEAERYRKNKLCPFHNKVPSCTKDKANNPLGVCSIFENNDKVITCPIRFREDWIIAENAADFFFNGRDSWTSLTEVRLPDKNGDIAGNIDLVLVSYDELGRITDFGALEIQAVYISGNIRNPFERYMKSRHRVDDFNWSGPNFPKADFLSSSRKRLAPQMLYKGGILKAWGKKQAVVIQKSFFETLPPLKEVPISQADVAWLLYDLKLDSKTNRFKLTQGKIVYTEFEQTLRQITNAEGGKIEDFIEVLQEKLDEKLEGHAPDAPTITDIELS